jgi:hypothetical protein
MSGAPLTQPLYVLTTALYAALSPLVDSVGDVPAYHWRRATEETTEALTGRTIPGMLLAFASTPFRAEGFIDGAESAGTIVVKALAHSDDAAQALLAEAVEALAAPLSPPAGYAVQLEWLSELDLPDSGGIWQAGATYRASIRRAPRPTPIIPTGDSHHGSR